MGQILKVTAAWSGFVGSPGYSNFYFRETDQTASWDAGALAAGDKVNAFFTAIRTLFPAAVKWKVATDVPVIDEFTGDMVNIASAGTRTEISGNAISNPYSAATGAVVTWRTTGVRNGRRVRGRTFLVPGALTMLDTDGTLVQPSKDTIITAANALIAPSPDRAMVVWSRPSTPTAADGIAYNVTSVSVPDKVAVLKSRRD